MGLGGGEWGSAGMEARFSKALYKLFSDKLLFWFIGLY